MSPRDDTGEHHNGNGHTEMERAEVGMRLRINEADLSDVRNELRQLAGQVEALRLAQDSAEEKANRRHLQTLEILQRISAAVGASK